MATSNGSRALEALGISALEERVYLALLDRPDASLPELARDTGLPSRTLQRVLDDLAANDLLTFTNTRPRRYIPASPDIALEALVLRRQDALRRARGEIPRLQKRAAESTRERRQVIELVTSREAERHIFEQMQNAAQHELVFLERAPILIAGPNQSSETELKALARGVRYRSIADQAFLEIPGVIARIRADIESGEEVRVVSRLPFKMVMADRSVALIPLDLERPGSPTLLLRASALLDALHAMFEYLWNQAAPIAFSRAGKLQTGKLPATAPAEAGVLLQLLSAGLNDKAIMHELGISASTLNRRLGEIMRRMHARTRFQLGWLAAQRGKAQRE
jgi:sugar-specific transcriptional regulator TrmB